MNDEKEGLKVLEIPDANMCGVDLFKQFKTNNCL